MLAVLAPPRSAAAEPEAQAAALPSLLAGLADHAARFEQMKTRGSFTLRGHMDELDGDGHPSSTKDLVLRVEATSSDPVTKIVHYAEDGKDKTAEARDEAAKKKRKGGGKKRPLHLPFLGSEQPRYTFSIAEHDPAVPTRVRVSFAPKTPAEDAFHGSAWVDTRDREVLSMGFSPSKNPTFVEHVDVTLLFGLRTELGRAPSKLTFEARGGILFFKMHVRGEATISDASVKP